MLNVELFSAKACDCELVNCELYHELIGDDSQLPRWGAVVVLQTLIIIKGSLI